MTTQAVKTAPTPETATAPAVPAPFSPGTARRLATVERTAYGVAGAVAVAGPLLGNGYVHAGAVALGAGTLLRLWAITRFADHGRLLTASQRALPALALSGCYTAALIAPGTSWWEIAAPIATAALAGIAAPLTRSRFLRHSAENLPALVEDQGAALARQEQEVPADPFLAGIAEMWAASPATGTTALNRIQLIRPEAPDFVALIQAGPGEAVPKALDERVIAAVFDVPVSSVQLAEVEGSGPGRLAVRVAPDETRARAQRARTPDEVLVNLWAERVASRDGVAPGMNLVDHRIEDDRIRMRVEAAESQMIRLPRLPIARALHVKDSELIMIESDGLAAGVVTVYREHPLINIREATVADLTMDADGQIVLGLLHDGRPARIALYDPELGAITDIVVGAPGSGKSVTLNHIIAPRPPRCTPSRPTRTSSTSPARTTSPSTRRSSFPRRPSPSGARSSSSMTGRGSPRTCRPRPRSSSPPPPGAPAGA